MKKLVICIAISGMVFTTYSCRETTRDETEEAVEAIGEDVEAGAEEAGERLERGAEDLEREIDEEIHEDDHIEPEENL